MHLEYWEDPVAGGKWNGVSFCCGLGLVDPPVPVPDTSLNMLFYSCSENLKTVSVMMQRPHRKLLLMGNRRSAACQFAFLNHTVHKHVGEIGSIFPSHRIIER